MLDHYWFDYSVYCCVWSIPDFDRSLFMKKHEQNRPKKKLEINLSDPTTRRIWNTILKVKKKVEKWPSWKRGDDYDNHSQT